MRYRIGSCIAVALLAACTAQKDATTTTHADSVVRRDSDTTHATLSPTVSRSLAAPTATSSTNVGTVPCISTANIKLFQDSVAKLLAKIAAKKVDTVRVTKTVTVHDTIRVATTTTIHDTVRLVRVDTFEVTQLLKHDTVFVPLMNVPDTGYYSMKPARIVLYRVDVYPPVLMSDTTHIDSGQTIKIQAMCINQYGNPIPCPTNLKYESSDTSVATVKKISWLHVPAPYGVPFPSHGVPHDTRLSTIARFALLDPRTVHYSRVGVRPSA